MRLPFARRTDHALEPISTAHSGALSELHRQDFSRPWSDAEFADLIAQDTVFGFAARAIGKAPLAGFVLARLAAGEAEILTIAVAAPHRRRGLGRTLMDAVLHHLHRLRAEALFLEVDETNVAALALYRRLGFAPVGRRRGYYRGQDGQPTGALVMRRGLR